MTICSGSMQYQVDENNHKIILYVFVCHFSTTILSDTTKTRIILCVEKSMCKNEYRQRAKRNEQYLTQCVSRMFPSLNFRNNSLTDRPHSTQIIFVVCMRIRVFKNKPKKKKKLCLFTEKNRSCRAHWNDDNDDVVDTVAIQSALEEPEEGAGA
jgi:hypothetical protein